MGIPQILFLGLVQGLTEFLPISSTAHLILIPILIPRFVEWPDQGLDFDVAVHMGTLLAVVTYFRSELSDLTRAWARSLSGRTSDESRLAWGIILGTVPLGLAGVLVMTILKVDLRTMPVIAVCTLIFALLLGVASKLTRGSRDEHGLSWMEILLVGAAQALAVLPGTSRAGVTITAGLFLGLSRSGAARLSFLLSVPAILLAGGYETFKLVAGTSSIDWQAMVLGALVAAVSAFVCIHAFLRLVEYIGMMPFVVYRLAMGSYLLYLCF